MTQWIGADGMAECVYGTTVTTNSETYPVVAANGGTGTKIVTTGTYNLEVLNVYSQNSYTLSPATTLTSGETCTGTIPASLTLTAAKFMLKPAVSGNYQLNRIGR